MIRQQREIPTLEAIDGGKVEAEYGGKPLQLSCSEIQALWTNGLINEAAYVMLALMIEAPSLEPNTIFDYYKFQDDWTATTDEGKERTPKIDVIIKALDKLQKAALADVKTTTQLTLSFEKL